MARYDVEVTVRNKDTGEIMRYIVDEGKDPLVSYSIEAMHKPSPGEATVISCLTLNFKCQVIKHQNGRYARTIVENFPDFRQPTGIDTGPDGVVH